MISLGSKFNLLALKDIYILSVKNISISNIGTYSQNLMRP